MLLCIKPDRRIDDQLFTLILACYGERINTHFNASGRWLQNQTAVWLRGPKLGHRNFSEIHDEAMEDPVFYEFARDARSQRRSSLTDPPRRKSRFRLRG